MDEPGLERQQSAEGGNGLRGGLFLEPRYEAELARDDLEH